MNHLSIFFSRYTKSIIRLSRTNRTIPIPRLLNHLPRTRIQLQLPYKVQNPETKNTESNRTRIPTTNQEANPIQPNKPNNPNPNQNPILNKYRELPKQRRKFPIIILNPNNPRTKGI